MTIRDPKRVAVEAAIRNVVGPKFHIVYLDEKGVVNSICTPMNLFEKSFMAHIVQYDMMKEFQILRGE